MLYETINLVILGVKARSVNSFCPSTLVRSDNPFAKGAKMPNAAEFKLFMDYYGTVIK